MNLDSILLYAYSQLYALIGGVMSLLLLILFIFREPLAFTFREPLALLLSRLPAPLVPLIANLPIVAHVMRMRAFQIKFRQQVQKAKERLRGIEATVSAYRAMPVPNLLRELEQQPARNSVLEAWGALQQSVYDACTASKIPLTPATRIPEAVRRLADVNAINADMAYVINVLHQLGQELASETALSPLADRDKDYKELTDVVVDWMMLSILSPGKVAGLKQGEEVNRQRKTIVGGHYPQPWPGYPAVLLIGVEGPVHGQRFSIEKEHYRIGSNANNDLRIIGDDYVSGNHASLRYEKGSLFLSDQASRNGSFLNEKQVTGTAVLVRPGDQIRLGRSVFQVAEPQA